MCNDSDLRQIALGKAISVSNSSTSNANVVGAAEVFYEFLKGDTKDEDKEPKKDPAAPSLD